MSKAMSTVCSVCETPFEYEWRGKARTVCSDACRLVSRRATTAKYREANRDRLSAEKLSWARANPDRAKAATYRWRAKNAEKLRVRERLRTVDPVAKAEVQRRRRARKRSLTVARFTEAQLRQRFSMFVGCWICHATDTALEVDHVKPLSAGGAHMLANIRPACRSCNAKKSKRWPFAA
jgi:5-methylcytosine-specific restriction endonuclease McrA